MCTPRSPSVVGLVGQHRAAARRSTLKLPIRFTRMTVSNVSRLCGPLRPAVFSAGPMPAQLTLMRSPSSPAAATTAASTCVASVTSVCDEARAELVGQRLAALRVEVGDRDVRAGGVQRAGRRGAEAGRPAGYECVCSSDIHGRGN